MNSDARAAPRAGGCNLLQRAATDSASHTVTPDAIIRVLDSTAARLVLIFSCRATHTLDMKLRLGTVYAIRQMLGTVLAAGTCQDALERRLCGSLTSRV